MNHSFIKIFVIFGCINLINSSFCGESALPYYRKISSKNEIILGCGKPTCLNFPNGATSHFTELEDGYFDGFISLPKNGENSLNITEKIECDKQFGKTNCISDGDWVGGIHPRSFNNERLVFRCCRNSVMKDAKFQRVIDLTTNEEFINGGDVYLKGKLIGFDYISNIIKFETDHGTMYELYINRMFCQKLHDLDIEDLQLRPIQRISNSEKVFVEVVEEDENPAKKYLDDQKPKIFQAPLVETQNVNNVEELQNINNNNVAPQEPAQPVIEQSNNALVGDAGVGAGAGACSTCTAVQIVTGTQLGPDIPITQTAAANANGCTVVTVTCASVNPNEQISLNWAGQGVSQGTTIGTGSVTETLTCNNAGQLILNEQNAGIVDQAVCVSRVPPPLPPPPPPPQPVPPPAQPVPPSSYYPVAGGSSLLNYLCFSADTLVTTLDGTKKRMDDLKINDWILSGNDKNGNLGFSKVSAWIHKKPNLKAKFIKFSLKNGQHLKITNMHYIFKGNCKSKKSSFENMQMVFAQNVSIHDCLYTLNSQNELIETQISSIEMIEEKGIYAPLTATGNIIVNDIFASCYSNVDAKHIQFSLPSFTEFVKYISSFFHAGHISSSQSLKSFSNEYDLMPGFKFLANILKDVLPNKY